MLKRQTVSLIRSWLAVSVEESVFLRPRTEFNSRAHIQLPERVLDVALYGALRAPQLRGNIFVGSAASHEFRYLQFPLGKPPEVDRVRSLGFLSRKLVHASDWQ
jgi:hypothetical protein